MEATFHMAPNYYHIPIRRSSLLISSCKKVFNCRTTRQHHELSPMLDSSSSSVGTVVVVVDYNNEEQSWNQIYHSNVSADCILVNKGLLASTSTSSEDDSTQNTKWRVWFQIHYKDMDGCLEVAIFRVKAVNGQPESLPSKLSENFFFVVCVLPEESTKVQTRTCSVHESAAFHDTVYLKISKTDFYDRAIRISMYKVNDVKQRMCCGHTMVKLGLLDFDRCETYYFCNELDSLAKVMTKSRGEMHLSLGYDHKKERLAAQVFAARCLPETSAEQKFYMKTIVTVGRRRVKVDCGELCNSLSGIFKCSYSFHIPPRWLQSCSIQFLICEVRNGSERRWGHVVVGSCRYAHGTGLEHWNEMTNQQPKIIEMWHMIRHG
ncbi:Synaptotagmin-12 [Trichinella pseudospiralis]|uniref:Synaptotagmin-12 n=1 Tax=Trichinella pseudospiralis TaxID=6337 RepID=A0A0V1E3I4_TRIPS|nr:Synaptotagmin-12 [Trichinella pseudospiralis]